MSVKLWNGRFKEAIDKSVERFTASVESDSRLYAYDIQGSIAHCKMLAKQGIITEEEAAALIEGLDKIKQEIAEGTFEFDEALEDVHMNIESRLAADVGDVAKKIHTARSRNDQVALDTRMYLRDECKEILRGLGMLKKELVGLAKKYINVMMPGYTHVQRAQPILLSHYFMAYYEMFKRDSARFKEELARINVLPLGSAALAGTTFPIDMHYTAELLDFPKVTANSLDAVSDRDFIIEFLASASICMVHLSRLSEDLIYWSSAEFGFVEMPDSFSTGSSIMPQKKNPDICELVRGKAGRVFGSLMTLLTVMKALPLAYNRDMQEDKEPLFDTVDTLKACLLIYGNLLPKLRIHQDRMRDAANSGFLNATDLADYLVTKGVEFRSAHRIVGEAVGYCLQEKKELHALTLEELRKFSPAMDEDVFEALSLESSINRRTSIGGTARENVCAAIRAAEEELGLE
jgi:argininosuccinate lyase